MRHTVVIAALFLLPPVGFAIERWWSACWQRGNGELSGSPTVRSDMVGLVMRVIVLVLVALLLPEYHQIFINRWLKSHFGLRLGWRIVA
ncbi:hypothetical protein ACNKHV_01110 [Shigella flexneri]